MHMTKKLWTERGLISQKLAEPNKPDMVFTSHSTKFQTAFGKEGSKINSKQDKNDEFYDRQKFHPE